MDGTPPSRGSSATAARRARAARYDEALAGAGRLIAPAVLHGRDHAYQTYAVMVSPGGKRLPAMADLDALNRRRNAVMGEMERAGIGVRQGTPAVHTLGYYQSRYGYRDEDLPNSLLADRLSIGLPLYPQMTDGEQDRVLEMLCAV